MSSALWAAAGAAAMFLGLVAVIAARGARRCPHEQRTARLERLLATTIELRVGDGPPVLGPMTLEHLAWAIYFGGYGYSGGDDLLADSLVRPDPAARVRLLVKPPPEPLTGR